MVKYYSAGKVSRPEVDISISISFRKIKWSIGSCNYICNALFCQENKGTRGEGKGQQKLNNLKHMQKNTHILKFSIAAYISFCLFYTLEVLDNKENIKGIGKSILRKYIERFMVIRFGKILNDFNFLCYISLYVLVIPY